jgi:hypothetical protein
VCLLVGEALDEELVDNVAQRPPEQVAAGHDGGRRREGRSFRRREGAYRRGLEAAGQWKGFSWAKTYIEEWSEPYK